MASSGPGEEEVLAELGRLEEEMVGETEQVRELLVDEERWLAEEIVMRKQSSSELAYPKYDKRVSYYQEFWKVYLINEIMISKIKDYSAANRDVSARVLRLDGLHADWATTYALRSKKKVRRPSDMIDKVFDCPFAKCGRNYGSDVSLNLHMKLKHNSGTKTERETLAREICLAEQRGEPLDYGLEFPPGYL